MPLVYFMPALSTAAPPSPQPQEETRALGRDIKFGVNDGDFEVTHDGDYLLVEGTAALRQAVYNCMVTTPGDYKYRPEYGIGLPGFLGKLLTPSAKEEVKERVRRGLLQMRRISEVLEVSVDQPDGTPYVLKVNMIVRAAGRVVRFVPFEFRSP